MVKIRYFLMCLWITGWYIFTFRYLVNLSIRLELFKCRKTSLVYIYTNYTLYLPPPPFSINFRCQIENQVSDYRLLGASSFNSKLTTHCMLLINMNVIRYGVELYLYSLYIKKWGVTANKVCNWCKCKPNLSFYI